MNRQQLLPKIKNAVISEYPSAEVILFGSRSRHDEHEFSDWDVLVVIGENLTDKNKIEIHNKIFEIELETGEIINSIIHTRKEWNNPLMQATPFYHNVLQEGVPL